MPKHNLVLDIDGVVVNFAKAFSEYYNKLYGADLIPENPHACDYGMHGQKYSDLLSDLHKFIMEDYDGHDYDYELLHSDFPSLIERLRERYQIHIVTSYPNSESRLRYFEKKNISYDTANFSTHDNKVEIVAGLSPRFIIEDNPGNILNMARRCPESTILYPTKWNFLQDMPQRLSELSLNNVFPYDTLDDLEKYLKI
jgi:uncharacterized HAD superfamily protein